MANERRMVKPIEATVNIRPERGGGVVVQTEITREAHEQLRLELMLRKRRGAPATSEALIAELIDRARRDWPRMPEEEA